DGLVEGSSWEAVLDAEPGPQDPMSNAELDACLEALADFCDLKSRYFYGHSSAVSSLAATAATLSKLPPAEVEKLRRAALIHEIGLTGISSSIAEKEMPLTDLEQERL